MARGSFVDTFRVRDYTRVVCLALYLNSGRFVLLQKLYSQNDAATAGQQSHKFRLLATAK